MAAPTLDPYVVDVLMPDLVGHDRSPSAFIVYVYLAHAAGSRGRVQVSYAAMASDTGLSKTCVQRAVAHLRRRKLVVATKATRTSVPDYRVTRPWVGRLPG